MPRKAKDKNNEIIEKEVKAKKSKVSDTKNTTSRKSVKSTSKTVSKNASTEKKSATKKNKTVTSKKTSAKPKNSSSSKKSSVKKAVSTVAEYYDLPFTYNQTIVKILAQTPNTLFIYWDISTEDKKTYIDKYGENFFINTKPYLIVTNKTMNYTFEVEINDFANSWYLHINDADCEYAVELCRKFIVDSENSNNSLSNLISYHVNDYLSITTSNKMEAPNNHILFDKLGKSVFFRNVKTNITKEKNISSLSFIQKIGKVYNIYDLYKTMYQDEINIDEFGANLPSSSSFK